MRDGQIPLAAWLLFGVAALCRLSYLVWGPEVAPQDTADYDEIARNLLVGRGFVAQENWFGHELRSWRPPLYPLFLAGIYSLVGYSHLAVKVVQSLIGSGTVVLIYCLARHLHSRAALWAGVAACVYGPLVASSNEVMSETVYTFLVVLAVYLLVDTSQRPGASWPLPVDGVALAGVAIGLAALTRPVGLLLWPAALVVDAIRGPGRWGDGGGARRRWMIRALWITGGLVLTVSPWTIRNYTVHGAFVPISTQGGFIFARSNAADPDWRVEHGWRIESQVFEAIPSEVERDRAWFRQGLAAIADHPGTYLRLVAERFLRFWYFLRPDYNFWYMLVLPFAGLGCARYWRSQGYDLLSGFMALSLIVFCTILYGSTRFRLPMEPFLLLFAAAWLRDLWDAKPRRVALGLLGTSAAVNGLLWWQDEALREGLLMGLRAGGLK